MVGPERPISERKGEPADYGDIVLSRDETRIAADIQDPEGNWDIWTLDAARGAPSRLTFSPTLDWYPAWSPDGKGIAWSSSMGGGLASGAGQEEALLTGGLAKFVNDWSPDGRYLFLLPD